MHVEMRTANPGDTEDMMPLLRSLYKGDIGPHFTDVLQEYTASDSHLVVVAAADSRIVALLIGSYRLDID